MSERGSREAGIGDPEHLPREGGATKRRPGPDLGGAAVADPRPAADGDRVRGARCRACGYPTAPPAPWCPACHAREMEDAAFGPLGTVWSSTVVHIPVGRWRPPYAIAYVDLDRGPRVLVHLEEARVLRPGARVCLRGAAAGGDLLAASVSEEAA